MKWLLVVGALTLASLSGCCQPGGLFSQQPYGSYYQPTYAAPATTYAAPCACQ